MTSCRICLVVGDIRLLDLSRIYKEVYQKLTNTEFDTGTEYGMPSTVCYVCHRLLQRCHMFSEMARTSNRILQDLLYRGNEVTQNALKVQPQNVMLKLSLFRTAHLSLGGLTDASSTPVVVKDELILEYKEETPEHEEIEIEEFKLESLRDVNVNDDVKDDRILEFKEERENETPEHEEIDIEFKLESLIDVNGNNDSNETHMPSTPVAVKDERILEFKEERENETPEHEEIDIEEFKLESLLDDINNMHLCFICDVCNKIFHKRLNLVKHLKIHTEEKPVKYSCHICDRTFIYKSTLTKHMRIHTGEKPYSCNRCGKTFTLKGNLTTHMRIHTKEKPFSCSRCEKTFSQKCSLTRHFQTHTGDRLYSCNRCEKSFTQKCHLTRHMRIHTGENPDIKQI